MSLRLASVLLAAGPLAMLVVFALVRDAPPGDCDVAVPAAELDAYHAGLGWFFAAAELATLAVLAWALRAADGELWRVRIPVVAVAVAIGVLVVGMLAPDDPTPRDAAAGLAVAAVLWVALTWWSGARVRARTAAFALLAIAALAVPAVVVAAVLALFATAGVVVAGIVGGATLWWLWVPEASEPDLAVIATYFALVLVPTAVVAVDWHGGEPLSCSMS